MRSAGFVALFALLVAGPTLAQLEAEEQIPSEVYARTAELFAVDGQRRLNMFCMGDGTPAIVFVSGAWDNTMAWRRVQGPASRLSRACSYDRAGLGFSDPAARPSTARNAVDDLKNLLDAASVEMPVVLVGHSAGGLYAMLFTALYPDRVAGVVLVDPSDPEANNNFALAGHHPPDLVEGTRRQIGGKSRAASALRRLGSGRNSDAGQYRSLLPHDGNRSRSQSRIGSAARPASNEGGHTFGDDQPKRAGRRAIQPQRDSVPRGNRQW